MKKSILFTAFATFASLALAGCNHSSTTGEAKLNVAASTPTVEHAVHALLTLTPGSVSSCQKQARIDPLVKWNVSVNKVRVTVSAPGSNDEKLFSIGGFSGSVKAGNWVVPGVTFRLYNAENGTLLATQTVKASPCTN
jgi:hypothetical protein